MTRPAEGGYISQEYGLPGDYAAGVHTGRDWAGGTGNILATRPGVISFAGWAGDYGNRVEILTEGIQHSYSHLESIAVSNGEWVTARQHLGRMGNTGNSRGVHTHYEERGPGGHSYSDHRRPIWDTEDEEEEEDDMPSAGEVAAAVWGHPVKNHQGQDWRADDYLRNASEAPATTINYPIPVDGTTADFWSLIVDIRARIIALEARLDGAS